MDESEYVTEHRRVLHIVAGARTDGLGSVEAADALLASMAVEAPQLRIDELDACAFTLRRVHDGSSGGPSGFDRVAGAGSGPPTDALILRLLADADCYVLSVSEARAVGAGLRRVLRVARGPQPRLALADRRRWRHRQGRRMVVVAARDGADPTALDDLVDTVREAFGRLGVAEVGVMCGEVTPALPAR